MSIAMTLLVPVLVAIYTFNYGRWAWRRKLRLGAAGVFLLAVLSIAVPAMVLLYNQ